MTYGNTRLARKNRHRLRIIIRCMRSIDAAQVPKLQRILRAFYP